MKATFDAFGIDPLASAEEITERFRELAEAADEPRRMELRAAWEQLTLHPRARIAAAVATFIDTGAVPVRPPRAPGAPEAAAALSAASLLDLVPLTGVGDALRGPSSPASPIALPIAEDPLLKP